MSLALPQDLTVLVHHIELSKAGWRDDAIRLLLLSVIAKHDDGRSSENVFSDLNRSLPSPIARSDLEKALSHLQSQRHVIRLHNGNHKLSEATRLDHLKNVTDANELLQTVVSRFHHVFQALPENEQPTWNAFKANFLTPLVYELGAKTYQIMTGTQIQSLHGSNSYLNFVSTFAQKHQPAVRHCISRLLDPQSEAIRNYMLRLLNTAFLTQALTVSGSAMNTLLERTTRPIRFIIFVDTNYLFSLLGLTEHPADDVVKALRNVVAHTSHRVDIKFYVLPFTIHEAQKTISNYCDQLSNLRLSPQLAKAVEYGNSGLTGVPLAYVKNIYAKGTYVSAKDYFDPYIHNLVDIVRSNGIELYNASTDNLDMDQEIIDDIAEQLEYEKKKPDRHRRKPYQAMDHDVKLWHFAKRKRPPGVDGALDAHFWIVTLDFGLIRFDDFRRSQEHPPVCIHPSILLQILQLWIPSSTSFNVALMNSLRPMIPLHFDRDAEQTTIRIIRALSRYELGDLDHNSIARILLSDAVRNRIEDSGSEEEENEVIRLEFRENIKQLEASFSETMQQLAKYQEMNQKLKEENREYQERVLKGEHEIEKLKAKIEDEVSNRKNAESKRQKRKAIWWTVGSGVVGAMTTWSLSGYFAYAGGPWISYSGWRDVATAVGAIVAFGVVVGTAAVATIGRRFKTIKEEPWIGRCWKTAKWFLGVAGVLITIFLGG